MWQSWLCGHLALQQDRLCQARCALVADKHGVRVGSSDNGDDDSGDDEEGENERHQAKEKRKARKNRYMNLASKMRVDQMLEQVHTDAQIDFDYIAFLCASADTMLPRLIIFSVVQMLGLYMRCSMRAFVLVPGMGFHSMLRCLMDLHPRNY